MPPGFDCLRHRVWNGSATDADDVPYFMIDLQPGCFVPAHHHPTGALYLVMRGAMHFPGEGSAASWEMRWTAPGHFYSGPPAR